MWCMKICICICILQCLWTIRSLRTCVNLDIRVLLKYLHFQLTHPSKIVSGSLWKTNDCSTVILIHFFIDFGSQNPSKNIDKSIKFQSKIMSENMWDKWSLRCWFWKGFEQLADRIHKISHLFWTWSFSYHILKCPFGPLLSDISLLIIQLSYLEM